MSTHEATGGASVPEADAEVWAPTMVWWAVAVGVLLRWFPLAVWGFGATVRDESQYVNLGRNILQDVSTEVHVLGLVAYGGAKAPNGQREPPQQHPDRDGPPHHGRRPHLGVGLGNRCAASGFVGAQGPPCDAFKPQSKAKVREGHPSDASAFNRSRRLPVV